MEKKNLKLPMSFEKLDNDVLSDDTLIYSRVKIMHSQLNLNNSTFFKDSIDSAEESLKNKPILAYIEKTDGEDKKDFGGHAIEIALTADGLKTTFLERPIGVIPENNNYELVEEDGKLWVYADAYLWKDYMNDAYDIFAENNVKSVSMEIIVDDYEFNDDDTINITKFRYNGVTVLGDTVKEAMTGAKIEVNFSENTTLDEEIANRISDINERLEIAFASQVPPIDEPVIDEPDADPTDPEFQAEPETPVVEPTPEVFEVSFDQLRDWLSEAVRKMEDDWVWVRDFNSFSVVYTMDKWEDGTWIDRDYRINYTIIDDEIVLAEEKERVFGTWATQAEIDALDESRSAFEAKITELNATIKTITGESDQLTEKVNDYEANVRTEKEEELFSEFDSLLKGSDEYDELKVVKDNYSIDELEDKVYALYGRFSKPATKARVKPKMASNFSLTDDKAIKLQKNDPYGGIFAKKNEEE